MKNLINYIKEHGVEARETETGELTVLEKRTDRNGVEQTQWIEIEADIDQVRDWLGY